MRRRAMSIASRQRGVAVVTALLLTTLAITIVASLFWQQQVQVRSIENQRLQLQKKWVMRGALDWARLILREDARNSNVDHLKEPWAVKLEDTRLDQYVENGREDTEASDASLSGQIIDAQSRFNLTNLASQGDAGQAAITAFSKLLDSLKMDPLLAATAADSIAATVNKATINGQGTLQGPPANPDEGKSGSQKSGTTVAPAVQFLGFAQVDDLLAVPGFTPAMVRVLKDYVVVLPRVTPVNINTAPAEVIAAQVAGLSLSDAAAIVASRDRAYFLSYPDAQARFSDKLPQTSPYPLFDTSTSYFIVNGKVRLNRSMLDMNALVERNGPATRILWVKEN
jgi:general secretion pathway protein K